MHSRLLTRVARTGVLDKEILDVAVSEAEEDLAKAATGANRRLKLPLGLGSVAWEPSKDAPSR